MEHHSNIVPWQMLGNEKGIQVKVSFRLLDDGTLDLECVSVNSCEKSEPVKLVAVVHSSNVLGTVNPIKEMTRNWHMKQGAIDSG